MKPNEQLVKELTLNKCKVMFKSGEKDQFLYLWIEYGNLTKPKPGQGIEILGNAQKIFEKIQSAVFRYYPTAQLTSQAGNRTAVFRVGKEVF